MKKFLNTPIKRMVTLLLFSLLGLFLTVGMAGTSQIYIDDLDFDYSLDSLRTSADSYDGFSESFIYNSEDDQAENVPVYVYLGTFHPSGELRVYVDTSNELDTTLPMATAVVPDGSGEVSDLSGGFEVISEAVTNDDVGLKLKVAKASLDDVVSSYMDHLTALDYAVTPMQASGSYTVAKKYANYILSFKQSGSGVEVQLKGN